MGNTGHDGQSHLSYSEENEWHIPFHAHLCLRRVAARILDTLWPWMVMVRATWWRLYTTWGWGRSQQFLSSALIPSPLLSQPWHVMWQWLLLLLLFSPQAGMPGMWQGWGSLIKTFVYWARKEALGKDIRETRPQQGWGNFLKDVSIKVYRTQDLLHLKCIIGSTRHMLYKESV